MPYRTGNCVCAAVAMRMEETLKGGVEQMKVIFDLCDHDSDGLIYAKDFREIGLRHFEKPDKVDALLQVMDPLSTGKISFLMFCRGIETFLLETDQGSSSAESSMVSLTSEITVGSSTEVKDAYDDSCFSGDCVYPVSHHNTASLSNGYIMPNNTGGLAAVEFIVEPCEDDDSQGSPNSRQRHSTPGSISPGVTGSRESPTLAARQLMRKHLLTLPDGFSQGSTPAEEEEEVCRLSDQLQELSCRLEELEDDQKDSEGFRVRLKKENMQLKSRLEEYEDTLRVVEHSSERALNDSQERLRTALTKVRRESETQILDFRAQLQVATERITLMESTEISLKAQLFLTEEEKLIIEKEAVEQEERRNTLQDVLLKIRELLRMEREKWELERGTLDLAIHDRDLHMQQLERDCEELHAEHNRVSITACDMDREINRLKKKLEQSERRNEELQSRFLQEGKKLVAASSAPPSLAMEIDSVSKDEIAKALRSSEEMNARLNRYIEGLLSTIIEKHPELLEKV